MTAMVAECVDCRLAYQTPRPSQEACIAYMNWRWSSAGGYVTDNPHKRDVARSQMAIVSALHPSPGHLLDFGAGSGTFVKAALDAGWQAAGVKHSPVAVQKASDDYGLNLSMDVPDGRFDVITLWDVIEHLKDPLPLLTRLNGCLKPGGTLIVETGNYESWMRIAQGDQWGLYLLDHHYYFSPASLEETLHRAGFVDFQLLPAKSVRPRWRRLLRRPLKAVRSWRIWKEARRTWPDHACMHEMIAAVRRPS
ncbi:class I SAM-dependent methyltransferase [Ensifer sp. M14]|uniref:class I SAM-dependent methyltransferase n=1 Tax=Ensifer sp. M14 TaxID=2203782 RepID=UPI0011C0448E|nr:class I SAM-dependent methyltransferase [Ensifer sp. M14]